MNYLAIGIGTAVVMLGAAISTSDVLIGTLFAFAGAVIVGTMVSRTLQ